MTRPNEMTIAHIANTMIETHGRKARQAVVDEIVAAIKNHDLDAAKMWDEVGQAVDARLAA